MFPKYAEGHLARYSNSEGIVESMERYPESLNEQKKTNTWEYPSHRCDTDLVSRCRCAGRMPTDACRQVERWCTASVSTNTTSNRCVLVPELFCNTKKDTFSHESRRRSVTVAFASPLIHHCSLCYPSLRSPRPPRHSHHWFLRRYRLQRHFSPPRSKRTPWLSNIDDDSWSLTLAMK